MHDHLATVGEEKVHEDAPADAAVAAPAGPQDDGLPPIGATTR